MPGFYAFAEEGKYAYEALGEWAEGAAPNSTTANATEELSRQRRTRRRASIREDVAARLIAAKGGDGDGGGAAGAGGGGSMGGASVRAQTSRAEAHAKIRRDRHRERMRKGGDWRALERHGHAVSKVARAAAAAKTEGRQLSEEDSDDAAHDHEVAYCENCVTWAGEVEFEILQKFR